MGHFLRHPVVKSPTQNPHGKGRKNLTSDKKDLTCPPCARLPAPSQAPSLPQLPPNVTWWRVEGWKRGVSTGSCCCCTQWRLLATALVALVAQSGVAPTKFSQQRHQAAALSLRRPSSTENQIRHPMPCFPSKVKWLLLDIILCFCVFGIVTLSMCCAMVEAPAIRYSIKCHSCTWMLSFQKSSFLCFNTTYFAFYHFYYIYYLL